MVKRPVPTFAIDAVTGGIVNSVTHYVKSALILYGHYFTRVSLKCVLMF